MAKHLTEGDVSAIVELIDGWPSEKLTWEKLCDGARDVVGKRPTRQSLNSHKAIRDAYVARKKGLRRQGIRVVRPANLTMAAERLRNLEAKVEKLRLENNTLLERFVVWQYNAYKHGLSDRDLNEPLPRIDRDRSA